MNLPEDCKFAETHEWHRLDGKVVTLGITQYAADQLTDITYVELPEVGAAVEAGSSFGEIESVKATAELSSGVAGKVIEVNQRLAEEPELINNDPYGAGWMLRLEVDSPVDFDKLLGPAAYAKLISA